MLVLVKYKVPPPCTTTSPDETPSAITPETVVVVPAATLKVGSPDTVMALAIVVSAVVVNVAGVVLEPTKSSCPVPIAEPELMLKLEPALTVVPPV